MMTQKQKTDIRILQALFTDIRFESIFNAVDRLHDAASSGKLAEVTNLSTDEVIGWLRDIAYTANETIRELEDPSASASEGSALPMFDWEALVETTEDWSLQN
jgi:hypothetical protein